MKINLLNIALVLCGILLLSCEKEIDFYAKQTPQKLVINGLIAANSIFEINISTSIASSSIEDDYFTLDDAVATLYENGKEIETLTFFKDEDQFGKIKTGYRTIKTRAEIGKTYRLLVSHPNFETASCETSIPSPVENVKVSTNIIVHNDIADAELRLNFKMEFDNHPDQKEFYRFYFKRERGRRIFDSSSDKYNSGFVMVEYGTSFYTRSDDPLLNPNEKNVNNLLFVMPRNKYGIFTNELIDSKTVSVSFYDQYLNADTDKKLINENPGDFYRYSIYFSSLSADAYLYLNSANAQTTHSGDLFAEPVQVYSNIENGFGIFAGYTTSILTVSDGAYPIDNLEYRYYQMDIF